MDIKKIKLERLVSQLKDLNDEEFHTLMHEVGCFCSVDSIPNVEDKFEISLYYDEYKNKNWCIVYIRPYETNDFN